LVTERLPGVPVTARLPATAVKVGRLLRRLHELPEPPPFAGGQLRWDEFISWWSTLELQNAFERGFLATHEHQAIAAHYGALLPRLAARPFGLIHGDCQAEHWLVDPGDQEVLGVVDFADAQSGDPLMDIAVLTMWDPVLTEFVLKGHGSSDDLDLLPSYGLLRHLAAANWLSDHGVTYHAQRNLAAVRQWLAEHS